MQPEGKNLTGNEIVEIAENSYSQGEKIKTGKKNTINQKLANCKHCFQSWKNELSPISKFSFTGSQCFPGVDEFKASDEERGGSQKLKRVDTPTTCMEDSTLLLCHRFGMLILGAGILTEKVVSIW